MKTLMNFTSISFVICMFLTISQAFEINFFEPFPGDSHSPPTGAIIRSLAVIFVVSQLLMALFYQLLRGRRAIVFTASNVIASIAFLSFGFVCLCVFLWLATFETFYYSIMSEAVQNVFFSYLFLFFEAKALKIRAKLSGVTSDVQKALPKLYVVSLYFALLALAVIETVLVLNVFSYVDIYLQVSKFVSYCVLYYFLYSILRIQSTENIKSPSLLQIMLFILPASLTLTLINYGFDSVYSYGYFSYLTRTVFLWLLDLYVAFVLAYVTLCPSNERTFKSSALFPFQFVYRNTIFVFSSLFWIMPVYGIFPYFLTLFVGIFVAKMHYNMGSYFVFQFLYIIALPFLSLLILVQAGFMAIVMTDYFKDPSVDLYASFTEKKTVSDV